MPTVEPVGATFGARLPQPAARAVRHMSQISLHACAVMIVASFAHAAAPAAPAPSAPAATQAPSAPEPTISIHDFSFAPLSLTIPVGATVSWKNLDPEPHTVRSVDDQFRSGALDQNDSFSFKFVKTGTYKYVCSIHPQMVGTITVK